MYQHRTDLAVEAHEIASKNKADPLDGVLYREENLRGFPLTRVEILNEEGKKQTGKEIGKYLTLNIGHPWDEDTTVFQNEVLALSEMLAELIEEKVRENSTILISGLGNGTIVADSIGPKAVSHVIVTRHIKGTEVFGKLGLHDIAAICPGVLSQTGIESVEIIRSMCEKISPSLLIVIDSLASRKLSRLATTVQMSNTGLAPGSGIGNCRAAINLQTIGIPVLSIGVPTVVDAASLVYDTMESYNNLAAEKADKKLPDISYEELCGMLSDDALNFYVTPKDTDFIINYLSRIIGYSLNVTLHNQLSFEEISSLAY